ncbi:unnamed protein product [Amoebophrya sp. A25]|nr:unnamed protein product [Amoebophrya sp. A25]CAD7948445.1 unnamed protein product [Amoebophrya sp. A25]|eukprot:GSA25T00026346001.1
MPSLSANDPRLELYRPSGASTTTENGGAPAGFDTLTEKPSMKSSRSGSIISNGFKSRIVEKIREFQVERRGERFYRILHHDLSVYLTYSTCVCAIFHLFFTLNREASPKGGTGPQKFVDACLRLGFSMWLCFIFYRKPAQLWHGPFYFWMALHLFSTTSETAFATLSILLGTLLVINSLLLVARELRFYAESPELYRAFSTHATMVDERGRILFYRRIQGALQEAGASPQLSTSELNMLLDGLDFFEKGIEDPSTIVEELYINWDQFALLYEAYNKMVDSGKFAHLKAGAGSKSIHNLGGMSTTSTAPPSNIGGTVGSGASPTANRTTVGGPGGNNMSYHDEDVPDEGARGTDVDLEEIAIHEHEEPDAEVLR